MSTTKYTKDYFIEQAQKNVGKYPGYVYLGPGDSLDPIDDCEFDFRREIYCDGIGQTTLDKGCNRGYYSCCDYYTPEHVWKSLFGETLVDKKDWPISKIRAEYEKARQLLGKYLEKSDVPISNVLLVINDLSYNAAEVVEKFYEKHGWVIVLEYGCFAVPYDENTKIWEPIAVKTVDGLVYTGVKTGDVWKFGCATISHQLIVDLVASYDINGSIFKNIESVQIGKGIFPIDILKKMAKM